MTRIRLAHIVSHPIQYLAPVYREISRSPEIDFTVYFLSDASIGRHFDVEFAQEFEWSTPLLEGYRYRLLASAKGKPLAKALQRPNWDVLMELRREHYDVLWINSYVGTNAWLARLSALLPRTPVFFRDDTNALTPRPAWKRALKSLVLRNFLRGAGALYVGAANREYWESYGIAQRRLFFTPHCVDNDFWSKRARELRPERDRIRRSFGITDDAPVILFCGKFIPKKQPLALLTAFASLRKTSHCWLLMVGDGPLRSDMEARIRESALDETILAGFLNQDALPRAYTAADIFVLPSAYHETWGLVVNEAMNFSLPIVVADRVGCAQDLVKEGLNGFSYAYDDIAQLTRVLEKLVQHPELRAAFGAYSAQLVTQYSVEACKAGIVRAVRESCIARP